MTTYFSPDIADTSVSYVLKGLTILDEVGINRNMVLENTGITQDDLGCPNGLIASRKIGRLINNIESMTGLQGVGLFFGCRLGIASHGMLGVAAISQKNWKDIVTLLSEFCRSRYHLLHVEPCAREGVIGVRYRVDTEDTDYAKYISELFSATLFRNILHFSGMQMDEIQLTLKFVHSAPDYSLLYDNLFGMRPEFDQEHNELLIKQEMMWTHLEYENPETSIVAKKICKDSLPPENLTTYITKVDKIIEEGNVGVSFSEVARILCVGERTLRRKLSDEGSNFREITEKKKQSWASDYLQDGRLSVSDVAKKLGFYDTASFCKAFKKWNGITPKVYRDNILSR
ncbi:hypothetical protein A9Q99_03020 [Gammaproteobacteria bacterium 45_16_T64]|nr:hypothetical protein A9Q99_03020 [Gammaproteobacteria bacterium 45_16_T64]